MENTDPIAAYDELLAGQRIGVLATLKRDGRPQLSTIMYAFDAGERLLRISTTAATAKVHNLRRDPRASLHVSSADMWSWVVAEGSAELSEIADAEDDPTVEELVALYRAISGEHPDWQDFRRAMVADRRLVVRLRIERTYGRAA